MPQWIRALAQTTTYLGAAMLVVVWSGVIFLANGEREQAYEQGLLQGRNLTRVFEEYIARVIRGTDSALLTLRELYENDPAQFNLSRWIDGAKLQNDLTIQFVFAGPDGNATLSSLAPLRAPVDVRDRDYFQFHAS